jgi:hypothetical protein
MVTTDAEAFISRLHHRMPVMLPGVFYVGAFSFSDERRL